MKPECWLCVLLALISVGWADYGPVGGPVAVTMQGQVRGYMADSRNMRQYMAFSGIPYARPPVGRLRFQPPVPPLPWKGTRLGTVDGPFCIQFDLFKIKPYPVGEEDCLYLSVYTHNLTGQAPVVVFFHGGGFISGNGPRKTGPEYLMDEDIVVVSVNYRVGIYGFLSFEDEIMPGNQGLKDQVMALRWVHENIACFGGDPDQVTIMGESAGGASVFFHIISPLSKGLFHQAIAESGTSYNPWAIIPPGYAKNQTIRLMEYLGCDHYTTEEALSCVSEMDPKDVVTKLEQFRVWQTDPFGVVGPVYEPPGTNAFIVGPKKKWRHHPVPVLMGATSAEGLIRTLYFLYYNMNFKWFSDNFSFLAPLSLGYDRLGMNQNEVTDTIRNYYFPRKEITRSDWVNLTTMYSDALILKGVLDGANKHPGKVYFYYFDYLGENSFAGNTSARDPNIVFGAYHTDELIYLWKVYGYDFGLNYEDLHLSQELVQMWTNFIKFGNPTPRGIQWEEWTPARNRFLEISNKGLKMQEGLANERYQFWTSVDKTLYQTIIPDYY